MITMKPFTKTSIGSSPRAMPITKMTTAWHRAMMQTNLTNSWMSPFSVDCFTWAVPVSSTIFPIKVMSPVRIHSAYPFPSTTNEPLNTRHRLEIASMSAGLSWSSTGSLSPVSIDWSTFRSHEYKTRQSAGTFCPLQRLIMSPGTKFSTDMVHRVPFRIASALCGMSKRNLFMSSSAVASW